MVSATSQMLGLQSILLDWGWKFEAHVRMDATTRTWSSEAYRHRVQAMVTEGKISHVDAATMLNCVAGLGMRFQPGESKLTLKA